MYGREAGGTDDGGDDGDLFFYDHQLDLNTHPPVQNNKNIDNIVASRSNGVMSENHQRFPN